MENTYVLITKEKSFVADFEDGLSHYWTSLDDARKMKLSEAIALKEKFPNEFRRMGIKIHKVVLAIGDEVNI